MLRASVSYLRTRTRPPFPLIFRHPRFQTREARNNIFLFYFRRVKKNDSICFGDWNLTRSPLGKRRIVLSIHLRFRRTNTVGLPLKAFYGLFKRTPRYEGTQQQFVLIYDYQDECLRYVLMTSCEDKIRLSEIKINTLQSPTSPVNKYDSVEITFETGHYPRHIAR